MCFFWKKFAFICFFFWLSATTIGFQMISERKEPKYFDTECNGFSVVFLAFPPMLLLWKGRINNLWRITGLGCSGPLNVFFWCQSAAVVTRHWGGRSYEIILDLFSKLDWLSSVWHQFEVPAKFNLFFSQKVSNFCSCCSTTGSKNP